MTPRAVKDIIRDAIHALGVTQAQFAERLGVDPATVSRWVNGTQIPRRSLVSMVADTIGIDEVELWRAVAAAQLDETRDLRRERDRALAQRDELLSRLEEFAERLQRLDPLISRLEELNLSLGNGAPEN